MREIRAEQGRRRLRREARPEVKAGPAGTIAFREEQSSAAAHADRSSVAEAVVSFRDLRMINAVARVGGEALAEGA